MNRLLAFPVTIIENGGVQEVREYSDLYVILPILGYAISFVLSFWLFRLSRKETHISQGKRDDFSPADRTKIWIAIGLAVLAVLLQLFPLVGVGFFANQTPLKIAGYILIALLRNSGLPILMGVITLYQHRQNEKMLAQDNATELQEETRHAVAEREKQLRVAFPVLAVLSIAIAMVWRFCFPDEKWFPIIAYFIYINAGAIWLIRINRSGRNPRKRSDGGKR